MTPRHPPSHDQGKIRQRRKTKKNIQFCIMVCGASGAGRSTFVNTLCGEKVLGTEDNFDPANAHKEMPVTIKTHNVEIFLDNESPRISLTIVDTPGFGDQINNEESFGTILDYLEKQYNDILKEENKVKRNPRFRDNRVHVLLYFITPTGHGLREIDITLMTRLAHRVNIIPVIGKADSFTKDELSRYKKAIMEDIATHSIRVYDFPYDISDYDGDDDGMPLDGDDGGIAEECQALRALMPFAIVGADETITVGNDTIRTREYPWGKVDVNDPEHCDFVALRNALFYTHQDDLREITHDGLYEDYRTQTLSKAIGDPGISPDHSTARDLHESSAVLTSVASQMQAHIQSHQTALNSGPQFPQQVRAPGNESI